eukprot:5509093-Prymnesium_polylepis.1
MHHREAADGQHVLLRRGRSPAAAEGLPLGGLECCGTDRRCVRVAHALRVVEQLRNRRAAPRAFRLVCAANHLPRFVYQLREIGFRLLHSCGEEQQRGLPLLSLRADALGPLAPAAHVEQIRNHELKLLVSRDDLRGEVVRQLARVGGGAQALVELLDEAAVLAHGLYRHAVPRHGTARTMR